MTPEMIGLICAIGVGSILSGLMVVGCIIGAVHVCVHGAPEYTAEQRASAEAYIGYINSKP
jgi:hypothetical protein